MCAQTTRTASCATWQRVRDHVIMIVCCLPKKVEAHARQTAITGAAVPGSRQVVHIMPHTFWPLPLPSRFLECYGSAAACRCVSKQTPLKSSPRRTHCAVAMYNLGSYIRARRAVRDLLAHYPDFRCAGRIPLACGCSLTCWRNLPVSQRAPHTLSRSRTNTAPFTSFRKCRQAQALQEECDDLVSARGRAGPLLLRGHWPSALA